jgi:hypothetical protein
MDASSFLSQQGMMLSPKIKLRIETFENERLELLVIAGHDADVVNVLCSDPTLL